LYFENVHRKFTCGEEMPEEEMSEEEMSEEEMSGLGKNGLRKTPSQLCGVLFVRK
jgi:hypothetical protein